MEGWQIKILSITDRKLRNQIKEEENLSTLFLWFWPNFLKRYQPKQSLMPIITQNSGLEQFYFGWRWSISPDPPRTSQTQLLGWTNAWRSVSPGQTQPIILDKKPELDEWRAWIRTFFNYNSRNCVHWKTKRGVRGQSGQNGWFIQKVFKYPADDDQNSQCAVMSHEALRNFFKEKNIKEEN